MTTPSPVAVRFLVRCASVLGLSCLIAASVAGVERPNASEALQTQTLAEPVPVPPRERECERERERECERERQPSGVPIQGGERLAWDQSLRAPTVAGDHRFVLYVDGRPTMLDAVTCEPTATPELVSCSTLLPALAAGRHVLQLSAVLGTEESARSNELAVSVAGGAPAQSSARGAPCVDAGGECYLVETVARLSSEMSLPTPTPDGRLLLVDHQQHVRVVDEGTLLQEPALSMDRTTDRIVGLGVDPAFADTRAVFVAWIEEPAPGQPALSVARYRDVGNRLGQRAVVLTGIPLPASLEPRVAFDDLNRIYVAVPRLTAPAVRGPYDGALLRFSPTGTVPWESGQVSPVLAASYDRPSAMATSSATRSIWVAGRNQVGDPEMRVIGWSGQEIRPALGYESLNPQWKGSAIFPGTGSAAVDIVSVAVDGSDPRQVRAYLVDGSGRLSWAIVDERGAVGALRALTFLPDPVVSVAMAVNGELYALVRSGPTGSSVFSLLRVRTGKGR